MARRNAPINADVPAAPQAGGTPSAPPAPRRRPRRPLRPLPVALKGILALVVLAVVFILAAILGGGAGTPPAPTTPAPVVREAPRPSSTPAAESAARLGYPAFATSNTTRVGGADPAANAAAIALATYPSSDPAQRPAAVALVDGGEWQAALAASVLMAAPLGPPAGTPHRGVGGAPSGAPTLISAPGGVPAATAEALAALAPAGNRTTAGVEAFAIGDAAAPGGLRVERVAGGGAAGTAAAIAALRDRLFGGAPAHVVIASSEAAPFAMPAAGWAARSGDPILFAGRDELPAATVAALRRERRAAVYVLGPPGVISDAVARHIAAIDPRVRRVSGADPVANAVALARYDHAGFGWNVNDPGHGFVVARSSSTLEAAAAAPLSASGSWGPLLLTDSADTVPQALRAYLLDVKPGYTTDPTRAFYNHVWVIGDEQEIDVREQAEIDELAELVKIGGVR